MDDALIKNLAFAVGGLLVGGIAGFLIGKKVTSEKYESIIDIEIAAVKNHYADKASKVTKTGDYSTPEKAAEKFGVTLNDYRPDDSQDETIAQDAIIEYEPDDMPDISMLDRSDEAPYIITIDEYNEDHAHDYDKLTLTYYEEDDVLADDDDSAVEDPDNLVGEDALTKFGQWSKDKNIVYVRNEDISTDFEIIRKAGSYAEIVHGLRPEKNPLRRMRGE